MRKTNRRTSLVILQMILGAVVLWQSMVFIFGDDAARFFARHGLPDALRQSLGWTEAAAAILFLLPPTAIVGAWALLVVFGFAIIFHLLHGQFEVGGLIVYAAAVFAVLRDSRPQEEINRLSQ